MDSTFNFQQPPVPLQQQPGGDQSFVPYWGAASYGEAALGYPGAPDQPQTSFSSTIYHPAPPAQLFQMPPAHPQALPPPLAPSFSQPHETTRAAREDPKHGSEERSRSPPEGTQPPQKKKRVIKPRPPAPAGVVITEKSCLRCRLRKVKCDRTFPACANCKTRNEECDLISLHPKDKHSSTARDQADSERIARLEARLAELEGVVVKDPDQPAEATKSPSPNGSSPSSATAPAPAPPASAPAEHGLPMLQLTATSEVDLGFGSVDARLARPALAKSLSQHLCDAFFTSCCWLLPSFSYYRENLPAYRDNVELPNATKVAIAAFCAVGARASPHSAVLGIEAFPSDARDHPEAPLLSAGTRRQSACQVLVHQAHAQGFEHGLMDEPSKENLAALLALLQMIQFTDFLQPRKSRALLRAAIGHYRELQDGAATSEESREVQRIFGLAIFTLDSQNSAYARRSPLLCDSDVKLYFSRAGIAMPTLPGDNLMAHLHTVLTHRSEHSLRLMTAVHLIECWTATCQRLFAKLAAPPHGTSASLAQGALDLFKAVDTVRSAIQHVQSLVWSPQAHSHSHTDSKHSHEHDYLAQVTRSDRDLLDIFPMTHVLLSSALKKARTDEALQEVTRDADSRMRKALKVNALYAKLYTKGADAHMMFHLAMQLELTPNWTKLALAKVGEPNGPTSKDDEVTETELGWLIEALQIACYYTPAAERRLAEISPRFVSVETAPIPSSPFPAAVKIGESDPSPPASSGSHTPPPGFSLESYASTQASNQTHLPPHPGFASIPNAPNGYAPYNDGSLAWMNSTSNGFVTDWTGQAGGYST